MSEGMPRPRKVEASHEVGEVIPVAENWKDKKERPPTREYIGFEISVAKEIAERTGKSLLETVKEYAPVTRPYVWPGTEGYIDFDSLSEEEIIEALYEKERKHAEESIPKPYHEEMRYGCFKYHDSPDGKTVDIHFSNDELDDTGPLSAEKISRRLQELTDMFSAIQKEFPECGLVTGDSWLYNIEAYKRLFPESYTAHTEVDTDVQTVGSGRLWGQFQDSHQGLKQEPANVFLNNLRALEEVTPQTVLAAFPYQALKVQGRVGDFYEKYGIK